MKRLEKSQGRERLLTELQKQIPESLRKGQE